MENVLDVLERRGFVAQVTDEGLRDQLEERATVYVGFDPTADSLHVGHLLPIIALAHFQRHGHRVLPLVGGATGMVGDPSGKSDERNLLTGDQVAGNVACLRRQMSRFLEFAGENAALQIDNNDWTASMSFIDWLREVGKYFTVNYMIGKESVKRRLDSDQGISFTEFSYMTMQAYDFLHLFDEYGCRIQCGGTDQWGNITAGIDLIRKARSASAYGLTFPLIVSSSGEKFGKTQGEAVWLDPNRTSPYQFYQYWVRTEDEDAERFLKLFTFLELERLEQLGAAHRDAPHRREAQKVLAAEVTRLVHGDEGLSKAQRATEALFGGDLSEMDERDLLEIFADVPSSKVPVDRLDGGMSLIDLLAETAVSTSKSNARRSIEQGSIYLNNRRCTDPGQTVSCNDFLAGSILVLRSGKKRYHLVNGE